MCGSSDEKLIAAVLSAVQEATGRKTLACAEAFRIADEFGIQRTAIRRVCNEQNIKIVQCQLGCF